MIRYILLLSCCLGIASVVLAADKKGDSADADVKELQGTWQATKWDSGKSAPAKEIKDFTLVFKGDTVKIRKKEAVRFKLDPTKKPKWIDIEDGPVPTEGIYKLEDEVLTICVVAGAKSDKPATRPTEFEAKKGDIYVLLVLKRVKE